MALKPPVNVAAEHDLARLLRALRRLESGRRGGPELSYRQIAGRTGWSVAAVGAYLSGTRLPSDQRLTTLADLFGADATERTALVYSRLRTLSGRPLAAVADPGRTVPAPDADPSGAAVPRTLPAPVFGFTGRADHLSTLDSLVAVGETAAPVVISAMTGMPGVGKTALAVHWAHRAAARFPDGQLYVDLRGFGPHEPLSTTDALRVLLSGLVTGESGLPHDLAGRTAMYHRLLRGRSVLVLLDNANGVDQIRALLPPPPCVAVVTSRDSLRDLVVRDGARRISLDVLSEPEAIALLRLVIGDRVDREPVAARALARRCGCLPLALRVAAAHAAGRPLAPLADLVAELGERPVNLDVLDCPGDERTDVRSVFSWSLRGLPDPVARAFALLGLVPGTDIDGAALAALADVDAAGAARLAAALTAANVVGTRAPGRYVMHDLVRAYAGETCEREMRIGERRAATTRLLEHYLATATAAVDRQFPLSRTSRPRARLPARRSAAPDFPDAVSAAAWLVGERANLVRAVWHAARHGWPRHAIELAQVLRPFLDDGFYDDALTVYTAALAAADELGDGCDPVDRAGIHGCLGITNWRLGRLDLAVGQLRSAFAGNVRAGNDGGATSNMAALGLVRDAQGRYREAIECQRRGLAVAEAAGIRAQQGIQLINLGYAHLRVEEYARAADLYRRAHRLFDESGEHWGTAQARSGLAVALDGLGRHDEALVEAAESLTVNRSFGQVAYGIRAMTTIASVHRRLGRVEEAIGQLGEALAQCRAVNNPRPTAQVLNTLGETYRDTGEHGPAQASHEEARELAERCGDPMEGARALVGLGDVHAARGENRWAREYWQRAHRFYTDSGLPAASGVHARLTSIGKPGAPHPRVPPEITGS